MATIRPFRAFRPRPEIAERVACPPYDVINTAEARALAAGNPYSFLHVTRPEIDLDPSIDEHDDAVYDKGRSNLESLVAERTLIQDVEPRLYVYAQRMPLPSSAEKGGGSHAQVGIVGLASVKEYDDDIIKKHEKTRADKEDDRTRHIQDLSAHDEPVFLTYRARPDVGHVVSRACEGIPVYDFETPDGVSHRFWALDAEATSEIVRAFDAVSALYVADGHHRSAAASRVHRLRKGDGGEHDAFLAVFFPHDQMKIMAYNRVVRDEKKRSPADLLREIEARFEIAPADAPEPRAPRTMTIYLDGKWHTLVPRRAKTGDPVADLDCSVCQDDLLLPVFGVEDPRRDKHVDFVGGIRGAAELQKRVDSGEMTVGIHLYPTSIEDLIRVSDAGRLMPPKSTWFEPKLKSGLFVHTF